MSAIQQIIAALLEIPGVKEFLTQMEAQLYARAENAALQVISDTMHRSDRDPEFRQKFLELSSQLASQTTEEGKRHVLQQMQALRGR